MVKKSYVANLLFTYECATEQEKEAGRRWYHDAHITCGVIAQNTSLPLRIVAAVISALSPRNRWERNLQDAKNLIDAFLNNEDYTLVKVGTFWGNRDRAVEVLEQMDSAIVEDSQKTDNFLNNIQDPNDPRSITIDVWMCRAIMGDLRVKAYGMSEHEYDTFADAVCTAAEIVGEHPVEFQAIVWTTLRDRIGRKKHSANLYNQGAIQTAFI